MDDNYDSMESENIHTVEIIGRPKNVSIYGLYSFITRIEEYKVMRWSILLR